MRKELSICLVLSLIIGAGLSSPVLPARAEEAAVVEEAEKDEQSEQTEQTEDSALPEDAASAEDSALPEDAASAEDSAVPEDAASAEDSAPTDDLAPEEDPIPADEEGTPDAGAGTVYQLTQTIKGVFLDGVLTLSGTGDMPVKTAQSPRIPWYSHLDDIQKVVIEAGITSIGEGVFQGCKALSSVEIADSVQRIDKSAFTGCVALTEISLPDRVTVIDSGAFSYCSSLAQVSCPGVTTIGIYAFQNTAIRSFTLPAGLTSFSESVFSGSAIEEYKVEEGNAVYSADEGVLFNKDQSVLIAYPLGKPDLSYRIPDSVRTVGQSAFADNRYLQSIDLGKVECLEGGAFSSCYSLQTVQLPDSLVSVEGNIFFSCKALTSVKFGKGLAKTGYHMFHLCTALTSIDFGELTALGTETFYECTALKHVSLPATVTEMENGCFAQCSALTSFSCSNLTEIAFQAFKNDHALSDVQFNDGLQRINSSAFNGCDSLLAVTVPQSVTFVHSLAFPPKTAVTCLGENMIPFGVNGYCIQEEISITGFRNYDHAYELLKKVNEARANAGGTPLVMEATLLDLAMVRAAELPVLFSHTRPNGGLYQTLDRAIFEENIAAGQTNPDEVVAYWLNSQGHRENLVDPIYTTAGIGCFEIGGQIYWTLCFGRGGGGGADCLKPASDTFTENIQIAVEPFTEDAYSKVQIEGSSYLYEYALVAGSSADNANGSLTANEDGNSAESSGDSGKGCEMTVVEGLSKEVSVYLTGGNPGSWQVQTKLDPESLCWASDNPAVVKVQNGVITAVSPGTAVVSVSTRLGYYSLQIPVTVSGRSVLTNLKAVPSGKGRVTLTWDAVEGAEGYLVYGTASGKPYGYVGMTTRGTTFTDTKALADEYNFYWVFPFVKDENGRMQPGKCEKYVFAKGVCSAVTNLKAVSVKNGVKLSWNASPGAEGYLVYGIVNGKPYGYVGMTTRGTTFTDTKASSAQYSFYWIYPYFKDTNGKMITGAPGKYVYGKAVM